MSNGNTICFYKIGSDCQTDLLLSILNSELKG